MDNRLINVAAKAYQDGGLSIIPINHKTKRPASWLLPQATNEHGEPLYWRPVGAGWETTTEYTGKPKGTWAPYQKRRPTADEVARWVGAGVQSLACVFGAVSGNAELIDFDTHGDQNWYNEWADMAGDPVKRLGLAFQKTGKGYQVAYRCATIECNQKLALLSHTETMIETRGEGGYALLPPSLHPSGRRYELLSGRFSQLPMIHTDIRSHLLDCARQLNRVQLSERTQNAPESATFNDSGANEVAAAYNAKHSIEAALQRYNYTQHGNRWSRPGKADSLGVVVFDDGKAYAYSSNDRLAADRCGAGDKRPFTAFDLLAYYEHNENYAAATRAAAIELGMAYEDKLHTMIFVEGYDNAKAVRETMFPHGWVARGFRPDKINLDGISKYSNVIVWAYRDSTAQSIAATVPGAYPLVVPNGLDAMAMRRDGILQPYLEAALADAKRVTP
jgi:hypothetical protein